MRYHQHKGLVFYANVMLATFCRLTKLKHSVIRRSSIEYWIKQKTGHYYSNEI